MSRGLRGVLPEEPGPVPHTRLSASCAWVAWLSGSTASAAAEHSV